MQGHLRSSHNFESRLDFFPHPEERGKEEEEYNLGFWEQGFPQHIRNVIYLYKETKLYRGLQQRWHLHSDAALIVSVHPLIAPLFCQYPSEDLSSGKRSKLVPEGFFFSFQYLIDLLPLEHSGKKTSGPEAELCLGRFSCLSKWKHGLSIFICILLGM